MKGQLWSFGGKSKAITHGNSYALCEGRAVEAAKGSSAHSQVATLALTGMLFLFSRMANTRIKYSTPGSNSRIMADVWSPGTRNCISRPSSWVGVYITRYSVTRISLSQARFTVSSVTSVTMRSLGGDTDGNKKGQLGSVMYPTNSLFHWQSQRPEIQLPSSQMQNSQRNDCCDPSLKTLVAIYGHQAEVPGQPCGLEGSL